MTYDGWHAAGLTRVDPIVANMRPDAFQRAFVEAAGNAATIRFDLSDVDIDLALRHGGRGFVRNNYLNAELVRVLNEPDWVGKTEFVRDGECVSLENGQFVNAEDRS